MPFAAVGGTQPLGGSGQNLRHIFLDPDPALAGERSDLGNLI